MKQHWAEQQERGNQFALKATAFIVKYLPLSIIKFCTFWVVLYFYLTSKSTRLNIHRYQQRLVKTFPHIVLPRYSIFKQFMAFGEALTDRFSVWQRKFDPMNLVAVDPDGVYEKIRSPNGRGQILVCSHLGNVEICRAFANRHIHFRINVLIHSKHTEMFNQALEKAGAAKLPVIQVEDLNIEIMMDLQRRLEQGEWIAIAADRIPIRGSKTEIVNFLGKETHFPQGAWLLAALLKAELNTLFCYKKSGRYELVLRHFSSAIEGRGEIRERNIQIAVQKYANLLAEECANYPLLWFNFYNFWNEQD